MRTEELLAFIKERHAIYERRQQGLPKPWTTDPILQNYRFCNVYRELDTQTKWFAEYWREPNMWDQDLWFASLVFRLVNWYPSCLEIGYPVPWDPDVFVQTLRNRKAQGKQLYSGAYMISTHGVRQEKAEYLAGSLSLIWKDRKKIRPIPGQTLNAFHQRLMGCFDIGSFLAAQVIADIKYVPDLMNAPDWFTFAASGPGSRRGMNRILSTSVGIPIATNSKWKEDVWKMWLDRLHEKISDTIEDTGMPALHAQDLQNCLCEFDKYERVRLGEGSPKQRYKGGIE